MVEDMNPSRSASFNTLCATQTSFFRATFNC